MHESDATGRKAGGLQTCVLCFSLFAGGGEIWQPYLPLAQGAHFVVNDGETCARLRLHYRGGQES